MHKTPRKAKSCPACFTRRGMLPLSAFGRNCNNPDGLATYCKECSAAKQRDWKAANADKVQKWRKAYIRRVKAKNRARDRDANARESA